MSLLLGRGGACLPHSPRERQGRAGTRERGYAAPEVDWVPIAAGAAVVGYATVALWLRHHPSALPYGARLFLVLPRGAPLVLA